MTAGRLAAIRARLEEVARDLVRTFPSQQDGDSLSGLRAALEDSEP